MQRYGARIRQVMLNLEWYRENMPRYKAALEDGRIELPRDAEILRDHRGLVVEQGVARVGSRVRDGRGGTRHGDAAIAAALAYYASSSDAPAYAYQAVRSGVAPERAAGIEDEGRARRFAARGAW